MLGQVFIGFHGSRWNHWPQVGESQPGSSAQNSGTAAISMEDLVPAPGPEQSEEVLTNT